MKKLTLLFIASLYYLYCHATIGTYIYDEKDGDINNRITYTIDENIATIDFAHAVNGVYTAVLVVNNQVCDSIILVK